MSSVNTSNSCIYIHWNSTIDTDSPPYRVPLYAVLGIIRIFSFIEQLHTLYPLKGKYRVALCVSYLMSNWNLDKIMELIKRIENWFLFRVNVAVFSDTLFTKHWLKKDQLICKKLWLYSTWNSLYCCFIAYEFPV